MKIFICAGHTSKGKGTGAVGFINESNENRILAKKVVSYLKMAGHEVDYYEINEANDYLAKQVTAANAKNYDLVVQIHFNSSDNTSAKGSEVIYRSAKGKIEAQKIQDKLKTVFNNRGIKHDINDLNRDLYWLKNTKSVAVLIETCFVSNKLDSEHYSSNKDKVAKLISEGIHGKSIVELSSPNTDTNTFYRVVCGSFNNRSLAEAKIKELESKGFKDNFIDIYNK